MMPDDGGRSRKIDMLMKLIDMFHAASTADQGGGRGTPMVPGNAPPEIPQQYRGMTDMQMPGMRAPMAPGAVDPREEQMRKIQLLQMLMGQRR